MDAEGGGRLIYYDFGMMGSLAPEVKGGLLELFYGEPEGEGGEEREGEGGMGMGKEGRGGMGRGGMRTEGRRGMGRGGSCERAAEGRGRRRGRGEQLAR